MHQAQHTLNVQTRGKGLMDITREVAFWCAAQKIRTGLLTVWCKHTSASLTVQENSSPEVLQDIVRFFERLVPEDGTYVHDAEGPDDMPAHLRTMLTMPQLTIPVSGGRVALGMWQAIYVFEHRRVPHTREIVLHLLGE